MIKEYKKFNDEFEKIFSFKRVNETVLELAQALKLKSFECGLIESEPQEGEEITSYFGFCEHMETIFKQFYECESHDEIVRLAENTLRVSSQVYDDFIADLLEYTIRFTEKAKNSLEELSKMPEDRKQLEKNIARLLIKKACLDELLLHFTDQMLVINGLFELPHKLTLSKYKQETLLNLLEMFGKYQKDYVIDFEETDNIPLGKIKELFLKDTPLYMFFIDFDNTDYPNSSADSEKRLFRLNQMNEIDALDQKQFYHLLKKSILKYENWSDDKLNKYLKNHVSSFIQLSEIWGQYEKNEQIYSKLRELRTAISHEISAREDNFAQSIILLSDDIAPNLKRDIIRNFFKLGFEKTKQDEVKKTHFPNAVDQRIEDALDKIISNEILVNQIVAGEHMFKRIEGAKIDNELKGDYTFLVAAQMKSVERFLKEAILNKLHDETIIIDKKKYKVNGSETLATRQGNSLFNATLGHLDYFFSELIKGEAGTSSLKNKIFEKDFTDNAKNSVFFRQKTTKFYTEFISKIRNGHFHIGMIDSIESAQYFRQETAFWLLCIISELKGLQ